jgi:hypothetical protein
MFDFFIVTLWFEDYEEKYPLRKFRAAKCNKPSVWFKKYKLNKWDQVKD